MDLYRLILQILDAHETITDKGFLDERGEFVDKGRIQN